MNCSHGAGCFILAAGDMCPVCRQIVAAVPQQQATRGEVAGGVGHAPEAAPRNFVPEVSATGNGAACPPLTVQRLGHTIAASAPTPAATSPHGLDCGIPSANAQHGADAALTPTMTTSSSARPSAGPREVVDEGEPAPRVHGGDAAFMAPQHGAHAPAGSPVPSLLDLIDATPRARITDPDTAHQAATFRSGRLRDSHVLVLSTLSLAPLNDFELAARTGKAQTSIGCRRGELATAGMVAATGDKRPSPSGAPSAVWAITDLGRDALARERARSAAA